MRGRVLAVGHDAFRAGAQIVFLHILRWLREHDDRELALVLGADGALLDDYVATLPTTVLPARDDAASLSRAGRLRRRTRNAARGLDARSFAPGSVDVVYANSIASVQTALDLAAHLRCPTVCHVHELEMSIRRFARAGDLPAAMRRVDRFVAVSGAVGDNLVRNHDVASDRIERIPPCIPIPAAAPDPARVARLRAELGIPADAFVVGGCGTGDWRKGPDVFLLVAKAMEARATGRPVHFLWVGGTPRELRMADHDRVRLGLAGTATFVGAIADPSIHFGAFDAFLLSSREDPYPLVCLEAAAGSVPIVCFADAGGMPEFVEADAGVVVPYLDVEAAATALAGLAADDDTRRRLGARAAAKVTERCSVDVVGPQIAGVLDRYRR